MKHFYTSMAALILPLALLSQNVGINTNTPAFTLDVAGSFGVSSVPFFPLKKDTIPYWNPSSRQLERVLIKTTRTFFNVLDYGGIPDSTVNNTAAIQAAIDAAHVHNIRGKGGTVYLPGGIWLTNKLTVYGNVKMLGDGMYATILKSAGAETLFESIGNLGSDLQTTGGFSIEEMSLNGAFVGKVGIHMQNIAHFVFDKMWFQNFTEAGIRGESLLVGQISNTEFLYCDTGMSLSQLTIGIPANEITLTAVQLHWCPSWGIYMNNGSGLRGFSVDIEACGTAGNINTGGMYYKNNAGPGFTWYGGWFEVNNGTIVHIETSFPFAPSPSYSFNGTMFNSNLNAQRAIYFESGVPTESLILNNVRIEAPYNPVGIDVGPNPLGHILLEGSSRVEVNNGLSITQNVLSRISVGISPIGTSAGMRILNPGDGFSTMLQLTAADMNHGGVLTNQAQSFRGSKTALDPFFSEVSITSPVIYGGATASNGLVIRPNPAVSGSTGGVFIRTGNGGIHNAFSVTSTGNIGINNTNPHPSAKLEIESTTQGFLPPRMTAAQAGAIVNPAEGLMIYVTDTGGSFNQKGFWGFDGSAWSRFN